MLQSINLQLTELASDISPDQVVSGDSSGPVVGFAEILHQPTQLDVLAGTSGSGHSLPEGGSLLPQQAGDITLPGLGITGPDVDSSLIPPDPAIVEGEFPQKGLANSDVQIVVQSLIGGQPAPGKRPLSNSPTGIQPNDPPLVIPRPVVDGGLRENAIKYQQRVIPTGILGSASDVARNTNPETQVSMTSTAVDALKKYDMSNSGTRNPILPTTPFADQPGLIERAPGIAVGQADAAVTAQLALAPVASGGITISPTSAAEVSSFSTSTINVPVQSPKWGEALSDRVLVMAGQKIQSAEIRMNPAELGPIRVSLAIDNSTADVTFVSQHAVTREAIESALPKLRELLSDNGLTLGNASVDDQGVQQESGGRDTERSAGSDLTGSEQTSDLSENSAEVIQTRISQGLVDTFV